jgi:PmbA protein
MEEDPHVRLVPSLGETESGTWKDGPTHALTSEMRFEQALAVEKSAFATDPRVRSSRYVSFTERSADIFLANTLGLEAGFSESEYTLSGMFGAGDGEAGQQLFGGQGSRRLGCLSPEDLGVSIARRLAVTLGGKPIPSGVRDVVLDPSQTPDLLRYLAAGLNGEQVHLQRSYLRGRVGERVASAGFHLVDDPEDPEKPGSRPWDDEGSVCRRKDLIRDGFLKGYLYDVAGASRAGTVTTGNGLRTAVEGPPGVAPTHLLLEPGSSTLEGLVAGVDDGLYVTGFMGRWADPVTGRLSAAVLGARIENGAVTDPVAGVTLTGTLDSFLAGIDGTGSTLGGAGNFRAPAIRVRGVTVVGR